MDSRINTSGVKYEQGRWKYQRLAVSPVGSYHARVEQQNNRWTARSHESPSASFRTGLPVLTWHAAIPQADAQRLTIMADGDQAAIARHRRSVSEEGRVPFSKMHPMQRAPGWAPVPRVPLCTCRAGRRFYVLPRKAAPGSSEREGAV